MDPHGDKCLSASELTAGNGVDKVLSSATRVLDLKSALEPNAGQLTASKAVLDGKSTSAGTW